MSGVLGLGLPGLSQEVRNRFGELAESKDLAMIETAAGKSCWCLSGVGDLLAVFVVVDEAHNPIGVILDGSPVTQFAWYEDEDGEPEVKVSEWPIGAREFNVLTDRLGINPNVRNAVESPFA